jgi:hypothetical protein
LRKLNLEIRFWSRRQSSECSSRVTPASRQLPLLDTV